MLKLNFEVIAASSRAYFSVDVFVDGKPVKYINNFSDKEIPQNYTMITAEMGEFSDTVELGDGEKTVCIYLPWSMALYLKKAEVDDGAFVEAVKREKKLLAFGDSITQGYDALYPSNKYITKLAEALDADEYNKGIGGERFFPPLASLKEEYIPDYITVAYGTNDWSGTDTETFKTNCRGFYLNLSQTYPESEIYAITPIWRKDRDAEKPMGSFDNAEKYIREAVADLKNVTVISGIDFVPENERYFADLYLHPNDKGFDEYFKGLYKKIK